MRTISVKEAAAALSLTPRAVSYRLEKGQLKGTLAKNEVTGVPEWRIYPNKEILAGLNKTSVVEDATALDFEPHDVVDAEAVTDTSDDVSTQPTEGQPNVSNFQLLAEQFVRPLVDEVKAQTLALAEKDRIIEEQGRQLRLLPDLQRRYAKESARAEDERKAAELTKLESIALQVQIQALKAEQEQSDDARARVLELERALERRAADAEAELERVRQEKDAQTAAIQEQLAAMNETIQELKLPWYKKLFSVSNTK